MRWSKSAEATAYLIVVHIAVANAGDPTWVSLNLTVPSVLDDDSRLNYNTVDIFMGTPPQVISPVLDIQSDVSTIYSEECAFCPGNTPFENSASSTFQDEHIPLNGTAVLNGIWASDTLGFGGVMQASEVDIAMVRTVSTNLTGSYPNGLFALIDSDNLRSRPVKHIFSQLYSQGQLMNPVIGMRFNPVQPRLTVGALDPNDYEGEINWVPIQPNQKDWGFRSTFQIDGFTGRNKTLLPFQSPMSAAMYSLTNRIAIPDNFTYFLNDNYTGPIWNGTIGVDGEIGTINLPCNHSLEHPDIVPPYPYVDFSVVINGVTYQIDSTDNLLRRPGPFSPVGWCNVGISTKNPAHNPDTVLGLPFLRSVYVAYRFPTDSCPGYYGFAFPAGANRTREQLAQKPASTPSQSSQCLSFTAPTSTPALQFPPPLPTGDGTLYPVYGEEGVQVPLTNTDWLKKGTWNITS